MEQTGETMTHFSVGWTLEDQRESNRKYRHAHPDKMRETHLRRKAIIQQWKRDHAVTVQAQNLKWKEKNPEKAKAEAMVQRQVRKGAIKRGASCSVCASSVRVEFHHPDYSKPLEVVSVCRQCHSSLHGNRRTP